MAATATPTIEADRVPLSVDAHGRVRVGGTRVTLDTVIGLFRHGRSPEWIAESVCAKSELQGHLLPWDAYAQWPPGGGLHGPRPENRPDDPSHTLSEGFPTVKLADIYTVIGYYLRHRADVDEYLSGRKAEAEALRRQIEAQPGYTESRERLLARRATLREAPE
ncbi:MAG: DUF433 domain-containing protein [Chloroflexi bacterium]|nr:DUF433 domain-containing protein [Chloroflexota bacterium]